MQLFRRSLNHLPLVLAVGVGGLGACVTSGVWYYGSPKNLQVGYAPAQPIPYSHKLHVDELGLDCRYCHANVERSQEAMIPPTQTCMGCHAVVKADSPKLSALRESWRSGNPVPWVRVHKLPEHAYFDHSAHLPAGVGCASCHGRVDQMDVVRLDAPLAMGWCLECHRDPGPQLRPKSELTNMSWKRDAATVLAAVDVRAGNIPAASVPAASVPAASVPTASVPAASVPAAGSPSTSIHPPEHCTGCHR